MASRRRTAAPEAPPRRRWVFYYDCNCGFCSRAVRWVSRIDFLHRVCWIPFQSLDEPPEGLSWEDLDRAAYLDTGRGRLHEGFHACRMLTLKLLPLLPLAPVLWFPGMERPGVAAYRWIAENRHRVSRCRVPPPKSACRRKSSGAG